MDSKANQANPATVKLNFVVIWKAPVEFESQLSHHEDHEGKTEHIDIPSSWPSWLNVWDLSCLHNRIIFFESSKGIGMKEENCGT